MAILTNYEGSNDDYENGGTIGHRAQSFQLSEDASVSSISIYGSRGNSYSGTTRFAIYTGVTTGSSGTEVVGKTVNTSTLTGYGSSAWNEITFDSPVNLVTGTTYFLKVMSLTGSSNDEVRWSTDTSSPGYASGGSWYATAGDTGWVDYSGSKDKNFRINGTAGGAPANTTNFFMLKMC